jgi:phage baseplate assembly protein V
MSVDYGSAAPPDATGSNVLRSGTVVDRQMTTSGAQVRVVYPDRNVTSDFLPVGQAGSSGMIFHFCPRVGDNVLVAHLPTGIEMGTVIATNCTPNNPSFVPRSLNAVGFMGDDGSYHEYDPDTGCLSINGVGTIYVNANGQIVIIAGGDMDLTTKANLNIVVQGNAVATVSGSLTANVSGNATITAATATVAASTITLQGNVTVTGTLTVDGTATFLTGGTATPNIINTSGSGGGS